jgi:hypothetical protein
VETGTGRRQEGKKEERTEVEKEDYRRKQGRCIEKKIKMNLERKWVYTHRHNVGSWSDGWRSRYVCTEREKGREKNKCCWILYRNALCSGLLSQCQEVTCGRRWWETAAVCLFISVEEKGCPYLPPNGVNMKLINYCAVSF